MIKSLFTVSAFLLLRLSLSAQNYIFDSIGYKHMEIGRITAGNDAWLIRVDHGAFKEDFWPVNLTEKYYKEGQEVVFEGALGRIPLHTKLPGTPIRLTMIRNLYRTQPNNNGETITSDDTPVKQNPDTLVTLQKAAGKIILVADTWLIEQTVNNETKRYVPDFLPDDFKIENTPVTFSGIVQDPPPGVRMMGTPLKITELMAVEDMQFDATKIQQPLKEYYPFDSVGYLSPVNGIIKLMGTDPDVYIIEVGGANNNVMRYLPAMLPDGFKKDGLAVNVCGVIGKIPANVRMMGTPLDIKEIKLSE